MAQHQLDGKLHCHIKFGTYCQVYQELHPSNTPQERTVDAICLELTGNLQGSYKYFVLETRRKVTQPQSTPLPMPKFIIEWVEHIPDSVGQLEEI